MEFKHHIKMYYHVILHNQDTDNLILKQKQYIVLTNTIHMKNIMIKKGVYDLLKDFKGDKSFSDAIQLLLDGATETRRKNLRRHFGSFEAKELKETERIITDVIRGAKGRLF